MVFYFEWALTHRSFPRILPDSSYFPRAILKFLFEVWRKNDLSSVKCLSPRSSKFFSSLVQLFYSYLFRSVSTIHGGVSHRLSHHLKTKEEPYLHILSVLSGIHGSSSRPSSHNRFWLSKFFSPTRSISWVVFHFFPPKAIFSNIIHSSFQLSLSKSYRCIIQVFSNQLMISLFSCIYIP